MYISQPLHAAQLHTAIWVSNFSLEFSFSSVLITLSSYSTQKKLPYAPLSVTMLHVLAAILTTLIRTVACQGACFVPNGTNRHDLTNANIQKYASCESSGHDDYDTGCLRKQLTSESDVSADNHQESDDGIPGSGMDVVITKCSDGSYCCGEGQNASICCMAGRGVYIVDGKIITSSAASSSSTIALTTSLATVGITSAISSAITSAITSASHSADASSTSLLTPSNPAESATSNTNSTWDNRNGIIGGAVGGGVGLAIVGIVAAFFWYKKKKRNTETAKFEASPEKQNAKNWPASSAQLQYRHELPVKPNPVELASEPPPAELESESLSRR
ncbi:hypothetical protein CPAR01_06758 [Colletotrichum paranaense]|uniref:Mid2 domain-containing protein n=1 Tax=Colletotrichum paranaense TaxID=1914294 RepID=A0ABQ9SML9_9PEZI|nr:uncharacterized protein CPAR01_06758 [Colletotrichum paranaense]KAK1540769.1 hypothetical protein CPAR01_06758 [Colletotrichum paranaense]